MSSPTIDFINHTGNVTIQSLTFNVTTTAPNEPVILQCTSENAGGSGFSTVTSVVTAGLAWRQMRPTGIPGIVQQASCLATAGGSSDVSMEIWSAVVSVAGTYSVTVTWNQVCAGASVMIMGILGTTGLGIYDPGAMPVTASNPGASGSSNTLTLNFTTLNPDDLLYLGCASGITGNAPTAPSGWTLENGIWATGGTDNATYILSVSAVQSTAVAITYGQQFGISPGSVAIMFALTTDTGGHAAAGCGPAIPLPS